MKLSDFDYYLPNGMIAQEPVRPRDSSKLMIIHNNKILHRHFYNIIEYLKKGDVLVVNETKVLPFKLRGKKSTGARIEVVLTKRIKKNEYECRLAGHRIKIGNLLVFKNISANVTCQKNDTFRIKFNEKNAEDIIKKIGELPTPFYVKQKLKKKEFYQTVYARKNGSIAAPTAGLHFTKELIKKIKSKGVKIAKVCLHIGFGTFLPVRTENIEQHKMEEEYFEIDKENAEIINNAKRLFVVGTTSLRALESAYRNKNGEIMPCKKSTDLFIYPGYKFKTRITALITNFHLPKSTLLLLVSAFFGRERILKAYKIAIKKKYRFYSFGDAMLLFREELREKMHPQ